MKTFFISLATLALVGTVAAGGYYTYDYISSKSQGAGEQTENQGSPNAQETISTTPSVEFGVTSVDASEDVFKAMDRSWDNNSDTIGWLKIDGTEINNPVLQSYDNNFYLRQNENKQSDIFGCYFADYDNRLDLRENLSGNTVIYGHSDLKDNKDGKRFSQLFKYTDATFGKEHKIIEFSLRGEKMQWEIFSVCYYDQNTDYINIYEKGTNELGKIINNSLSKSLYDFGTTVSKDDNILVLSTCSVKQGTSYLTVMAKLLPAEY
ncbi:MAG: class B sortase [Oscillospiraceae bacterium]